MSSYLLSIEDVVASIFAVKLMHDDRDKFVSYEQIDKTAIGVLNFLNKNEVRVKLDFCRNNTQQMLNRYSDTFTECQEDGQIGIRLDKSKNKDDMIKLCSLIPIDIFEALYSLIVKDIDKKDNEILDE